MYVNLSSPSIPSSQYTSWKEELSTVTTCTIGATEVDTLITCPDIELNGSIGRASRRSRRTNLPPVATNSIISPTCPTQDCPFLLTTTQSLDRTSKDPRWKLRTLRVAHTDCHCSTSEVATLVSKSDCAMRSRDRSKCSSEEYSRPSSSMLMQLFSTSKSADRIDQKWRIWNAGDL